MEKYHEEEKKSDFEIAQEFLFLSGDVREKVFALEEKLDNGTLTGKDIHRLGMQLEANVCKRAREILSLSDDAVKWALSTY